MSGRLVLAGLSGGLFGLAVVVAVPALRAGLAFPAVPVPAPRAAAWRRTGPRLAAALAAAAGTLMVTGWPVLAIGMAGLIGLAPGWAGSRVARQDSDRRDALATWAESLRDLILAGAGLPEALRRAEPAAPPPLRSPLAALTDRLAAREPLDRALLVLADDLDDPSGDLVAAALALNARVQGPHLAAVLTDLARTLRDEAEIRRRIDAERRATRRGVRIIVGVTVATTLGLAALAPGYVGPYGTPAGQLVLALVMAVDAAALGWMSRLAALPTARRILPGELAHSGTRLRRLLIGGPR